MADYRLATVQQNPKDLDPATKLRNPILCAEPSPDVARAFSSALSLSLSRASELSAASGDSKNKDMAAALQYQTSQAVAQLGKRYATVQILRDVLHAQCVQFANGTMSEATWASLQSQFNSLVVTLLAVEMAGESAPAPINVSSDGSRLGDQGGKSADQLFVAAGVSVEEAKGSFTEFAKKVEKVQAAALPASAPKEVKAASTALVTVQGSLSKTIDALQKAWKEVTLGFGKSPTDATKGALDALKKSIPAADDKEVAAAATAVAAAASAASSAAGTEEAKSANGDIAKVTGNLQTSSKALEAVVAARTATGDAVARGQGSDKPSDASGSAPKVAAIAAIQKAYLDKDPLGPSLLACLTYLDPPGAAASAPRGNTEIRDYCKGVFKARVNQANLINAIVETNAGNLSLEDILKLLAANRDTMRALVPAN